ncbi:MAG: 30S ribosomal protein S12 methylthiotransferase RimO [Desulfobacterales bacterium]
MHIYLSSLGCVRNQVDSELMLGRLSETGHTLAKTPAEAEVIVVNTCAFIESAADEAIEEILTLAAWKKQGPCRSLIVTGCLPQRYGGDTARSLPEVDVFLGTGAYDRIAEAVENPQTTGTCLLPEPAGLALAPWHAPRIYDTWPTAYIKIMEGCGRHCTYCIIPKLRGPLRSREAADVAREAALLANKGFAEIVLVGQDTTSWGADFGTDASFADLLEKTAEAAPETWIRFLYGHPDKIDDRLLETIAAHDNVCSYLDIPVQHASGRILKRMGRNHDRETLLARFARIRAALPDASLRTTVLVGFPGETVQDFEALIEFVEHVEFDHLGAFIYSDADDLPSHRLDGHVSAQAAQDRHDLVMQRQADISLAKNQEKIGSRMRVLVEGQSDDGRFYGHSQYQAPEVDGVTFIETNTAEIGTYMDLQITRADEYDLTGVPV